MPIAQLNLAKAKWPIGDERMSGFVELIDQVNAVADAATGFLWRLQSEDGGGSSYVEAFDDPRLLINLSSWESVDDLLAFVRSSGHRPVMARRGEWFEPGSTESIFWELQDGATPTLDEALEHLAAWRQGKGPALDLRTLMATTK